MIIVCHYKSLLKVISKRFLEKLETGYGCMNQWNITKVNINIYNIRKTQTKRKVKDKILVLQAYL